jgi:hypothetical protein
LTHIRLHGCDNHHRFAVLLGSGGSFADGIHVLQQTIFTSCNVRQRTFFLPVSCVALADFLHRFCRFLGFVGWLFWSVVHIYFLITAGNDGASALTIHRRSREELQLVRNCGRT